MNSDLSYGKTPKTIRKILHSKIKDWLESIKDEPLREQVAKEVIVTGGSIASMLIGQPVNDYDLYLKTKATTRKLAEYYVAEFNRNVEIKVGTGVIEYKPYVDEKKIVNCKGVEEDRVVIYIKSAGCDAAYMYQLITALKEVEKEKINSCYVAEIIDRIFG